MRNSGIKKNHKIYIFKHQQTESGGGGGANLEDNKTATIDVSAYTGPVTINPTAGKDGMKKATVTLSNIPSGGITALYGVTNDNVDYIAYLTSPLNDDLIGETVTIYINNTGSWNTYELTITGRGEYEGEYLAEEVSSQAPWSLYADTSWNISFV